MVRTRFAPSPTGYLHVGGVRTALFAWLVAKQADGQFILRIEDTDRNRHVEESEKQIIESLEWLGITSDEPVTRQSERLDIYKEWGQKLIDKGRAYADPTDEKKLNELRAKAKTEKKPFLYRDYRPDDSPDWQEGMPLRFKSQPKPYVWHDAILGKLSTGPEVIDDFILIKSDGFPTYNFAHIIDDHLMKISHVMRSSEFLASVPRFLNLYEALEIERPILATLPEVLGPDGKKKLSKRDGAKDILTYKREGYLPEALINFMASLGWNDGTEQEVFSSDELIAAFDLSRVQRSGARFDEQRLLWMNGYWIRQTSLEKLYDLAKSYWPPEAEKSPESYKKAVLSLVQERLKFLKELPKLTDFFFIDKPVDMSLIDDNKQLSKLGHNELRNLLEQAKEKLGTSDFSTNDLSDKLNQLLEETSQKPAVLFNLIRVATTWAPASPQLADTLSVLGKDKVLARTDKAIAALEK